MQRRRELKRCFISASADLDINPLLGLLKEKGIDAHDAFSISYTDTMQPLLEKEINNSDFMIAVVSLRAPKPNVFYEIGFARAAKKQIFVIIQDEGLVPALLKDLVYVRAAVNDLQAIDYVLTQFLSKHKYRIRKRSKIVESPKAKPNLKILESDLEGMLRQGMGMDIISLVANLLKSEGVVLSLSHGPRDKGSDMSLWINSLESSIGNPILVEVKIGSLSHSTLERAEQQLRRYIQTTNASAGLLVYADRRGRRFKPSKLKLPLVIRLELRDLVERLSKHPIDYILLSERNRIAHSGE